MARITSHKQRPSAEAWIGGIATLPAYIMGEGEPCRPEVLLWVDQDTLAITGSIVGKPGDLLGQASEHLHSVIKQPMFGPPRAPSRVRVSSPELAEALRAGHPSVEIVCGPTPEIDGVMVNMREMMTESPDGDRSFLDPGTSPEAYASYFGAAAALFRAKPWKVVPADEVLSVTVEAHGLRKAALSVIGQMGESFGLLLFSSMADFDAYLDAADAVERGETPTMPSYHVLNFERGAEIATSDRKTISSQHWQVASPQAYPWSMLIDKDMVSRPLTASELTLMEVIATGLAKLVGEKKALDDAFAGGEPCTRTYAVQVHGGDVTVCFRAPHEDRPEGEAFEENVLDALYALEEEGNLGDEAMRAPLEDELCQEFASSPEGRAVSKLEGHRLLMTFAAEHVGSSIGALEPWAVREVLFDIIPRKVSVDASAAPALVADCRAFYRFLSQAYELEQAEECLQVLGPRAEKQLEKALANPSKYGPAKTLLMAGKDAGFDVQSKEGIEAWIRTVNTSAATGAKPPRKKR